MKKYLLLFLLVFSPQVYSQDDKPPKEFILDEITKFFNAEIKEMGLEKPVDKNSFEFREKLLQPGKYVNDTRLQWLSVYTICDVKGEFGKFFGCMDFLIIILKDGNKWITSDKQFTCSVFQFTEDLNNDGYDEIATASGFCNMGECDESYKIFSLKNNREDIIYSYEDGRDYSGMKNLKKGDTAIVNYKISFEDRDNDKVKELIEDKTTGIIESINKDGNYVITAINTVTRYLYTGTIYKKMK